MDAAPESDDEAIAQPTAEQPPASDVGADEEVFGSTPRASDEVCVCVHACVQPWVCFLAAHTLPYFTGSVL